MKPFPLGIWARLLLAFSTIAGITLIVATMALLIFQYSDDLFKAVSKKHVPAILQVAEFAEIGGEIIAVAPNLLTAEDEDDRTRIAKDIDRLLFRLDQRTNLLDIASTDFRTAVEDVTGHLKENLLRLQLSVAGRIELQRRLNRKTERLRWLYADLIGELDPLSQDYAYDLDTEFEKIIDASKRNAPHISLARLQAGRKYQGAVEQIRSNGILLVGLMAQAATSGSAPQIDSLAALSSDTAALIRDTMQKISEDSSTLTLKQVLDDLFRLAEGDQSVFATKTKILAIEKQGQETLTGNRLYVGKLKDLIDKIITKTHTETFNAVKKSRNTLEKARWLLVIMVASSLAVAASVLWFYVRRSIVSRLAELSRSMLAIAEGDLTVEIPFTGKDEIGRMASALKVFRDTALAVEEANAQAIIDNAAVGLIITKPDGTILFFNPMAAVLFATTSESMIGTSIYSLIEAEKRKVFAGKCSEALYAADNNQEKYTFKGLRQDGSFFPIDVSICRAQQRKQTRLIVTVHDVTEREQAEHLLRIRVREKTEHLRHINVRLRKEITERHKIQDDLVQAGKLAALGQLSAGIAHEINQPLAAMRYYLHNAEKLLERGEIGVHEENLAKISELIERMAQMIAHLKTFARYRNNALTPVNVIAAIEHALVLVTANIKKSEAHITKTYPDRSPWVSADAIRLEQVFVNIIGNALDAVNSNMSSERRVDIAVEEKSDTVTVAVTDNGPGIDTDEADKIFDPFFTTKEVGQGLGLGLSISYSIIKGFNGAIKASAASGDGACFTITLQKIKGSP